MADREFVDFVAEIWQRRDWATEITEDDPGEYLITGDRDNGARGLMLVVPAKDVTVAGNPVQDLVDICEAKNVDIGVVVTRGEFSAEARQIGDANDIYLVDSELLEETLIEEGLVDVAEKYGSGESASILSRLPLPTALPAILRRPSALPIPTRALSILLVVVGVAAVAIIGMQSIGLGIGIGTPGPIPDDVPGFDDGKTDVTVTAASLTDDGDGVRVDWNAFSKSAIVTGNETRYEAPPGTTFVVVQMNVTNEHIEPIVLREGRFGFSANDTVHGPRPVESNADQLPVRIDPTASETLWFVFTIDADETSGTLLGLPSENGPPIRFERDPSVETGVEPA
ncbi:restriction endonuclease [Halanaeroarchaeum sulfurireducens]|nr:restriction endonuclease [Halanaeroarchaeum sulfurireducens]